LQPGELVARSAGFGPWSSEHVARLLVAELVGLVLVLVGWWQAAGSGSVRTGLAWLNLCLAGLVVAGVGNGLWLLRGRQVVTLARVEVLGVPASAETPVVVPSSNGHGGLVSGSGLARFHRPGCVLVAGKGVEVATWVSHDRAGRRACEVCEP
jgi:hypothetical protein